jgi:hypothetical protein
LVIKADWFFDFSISGWFNPVTLLQLDDNTHVKVPSNAQIEETFIKQVELLSIDE